MSTSGFVASFFVVDSGHKDILGRPVRDYRVPNAQTEDVGWPSPNAEQALLRAQRADRISTADCVWGFTQIGLGACRSCQKAHVRSASGIPDDFKGVPIVNIDKKPVYQKLTLDVDVGDDCTDACD